MSSYDFTSTVIKRSIFNPYAVTPEERRREIFSSEKALESRSFDIDMVRSDFSLFTDPEMKLDKKQFIFFSLVIQMFKKIDVVVVNSQTNAEFSISLKNFIRENCKKFGHLSFRTNIKTLTSFIPERELIFRFPKLPPTATPSSVQEFNLLFKKLLPISEYNAGLKTCYNSESSPLRIFIDAIRREFSDSCLKCATFLSLLYIKKIFTQTLFLLYSDEIPSFEKNSALYYEIQKTEEAIDNRKYVFEFHHKLYQSLLFESHFFDVFLEVSKRYGNDFKFCLKERWEFICDDYSYQRFDSTTSINAIVRLMIYMGYDATNVVYQTIFLMIMNTTWHRTFGNSNPYLYSLKSKISKEDSKKRFCLVDIQRKKIVFDNFSTQ